MIGTVKTPWKIGREQEDDCVEVDDAGGITLFSCKRKFAEPLVHAVNCHAALLAACEAALIEISGRRFIAGCVDEAPSEEWRRLQRLHDAIQAAVNAAKGRQ